MLYFAYGSNLDTQQMSTRCPGARPVARAALLHHVMTFGGFSPRWGGAVANVVRRPDGVVAGLLYALSVEHVEALDRFEGHPHAYQRERKLVVDETGKRHCAVLYRQPARGFRPCPPPQRYLRVIDTAYRRLGFDVEALALAAGRAP